MEIPIKYQLQEEDYLELWKWFQEDAAKIKQRMWTMATFFYTLLGGTLGFIGKELLIENTETPKNSMLVILICVIGCLLACYGMYMIRSYGFHIRSGWNRADYIQYRIEGLGNIWDYGKNKRESRIEMFLKNIKKPSLPQKKEEGSVDQPDYTLPLEARRLIWLMAIFCMMFIGIIILTILTPNT